MKVANTTGSTLYVPDVDMHIPFEGGDSVDISPDTLKHSGVLRRAIINHVLDVLDHDPSIQIEKAIMFLRKQSETDTEPAEIQEYNEPEQDIPAPESLTHCSDQLEVEIKGVFYDTSGYGRVNRNLARKLQESGVTVKVSPLHGQNSLSEDEIAPIAAMEDTKLSNNRILIDSIVPTIGNITGARYKILYTTIESYTVPDYFIRCCRLYNEIWLTSEWSASVLRSQLPGMPIHSMNPGVDCDLYKQEGEKFDIGYDSTFIFLSVFVWSYRKGYDVLLRAFMDEFSAEDRVTLLLLTRYNQGTHISGGDKIKEDIDAVVSLYPNKQSPHVARIKRNLRENEMPKLYRAADAFVLPTRGEGIGLPPMEASLCGLPVIMTNCSGQQDYLRPDNSFPIEIDRLKAVEKGQMHIHYWDGMEFPDLTSRKVHEDLKRAMRYTYTNREDAKHRNRNLQNLIIETFSCNAAANRAASRLSQIAANMRR